MTDINKKFQHWSFTRQCLDKNETNLLTVLRGVIGVYSSHPSGPLSLLARVKSFSEEDFVKLDKQKLTLRIPAMRQSVYILPREFVPKIFSATIAPSDDPAWEKRYSQKGREISPDKYQIWKKAIIKIAAKPLQLKNLKDKVDVPGDKLKIVMNRMAFEGDLLRIVAESLRSNTISYVSADT